MGGSRLGGHRSEPWRDRLVIFSFPRRLYRLVRDSDVIQRQNLPSRQPLPARLALLLSTTQAYALYASCHFFRSSQHPICHRPLTSLSSRGISWYSGSGRLYIYSIPICCGSFGRCAKVIISVSAYIKAFHVPSAIHNEAPQPHHNLSPRYLRRCRCRHVLSSDLFFSTPSGASLFERHDKGLCYSSALDSSLWSNVLPDSGADCSLLR
ncbi:hypothetical protein C8F01DRAFT_1134359 [Mycena amicta]|nr:hypothetical protein C8F01DRAFT_1134359 [Mycena amicta]